MKFIFTDKWFFHFRNMKMSTPGYQLYRVYIISALLWFLFLFDIWQNGFLAYNHPHTAQILLAFLTAVLTIVLLADLTLKSKNRIVDITTLFYLLVYIGVGVFVISNAPFD